MAICLYADDYGGYAWEPIPTSTANVEYPDILPNSVEFSETAMLFARWGMYEGGAICLMIEALGTAHHRYQFYRIPFGSASPEPVGAAINITTNFADISSYLQHCRVVSTADGAHVGVYQGGSLNPTWVAVIGGAPKVVPSVETTLPQFEYGSPSAPLGVMLTENGFTDGPRLVLTYMSRTSEFEISVYNAADVGAGFEEQSAPTRPDGTWPPRVLGVRNFDHGVVRVLSNDTGNEDNSGINVYSTPVSPPGFAMDTDAELHPIVDPGAFDTVSSRMMGSYPKTLFNFLMPYAGVGVEVNRVVTYDMATMTYGPVTMATARGLDGTYDGATEVLGDGPFFLLPLTESSMVAVSFDGGASFVETSGGSVSPIGDGIVPRYVWNGNTTLYTPAPSFWTAFEGTYEVPGLLSDVVLSGWNPRPPPVAETPAYMSAILINGLLSGVSPVVVGGFSFEANGAPYVGGGKDIWFKWVSNYGNAIDFGFTVDGAGALAGGSVEVYTLAGDVLTNVSGGGWDGGAPGFSYTTWNFVDIPTIGETYYFRCRGTVDMFGPVTVEIQVD